MDEYEAKELLERLFWGVVAPFDSGAKAESIPFGIAIARAQAIVYIREIEEVRAALRRVEAGLPSEEEYPQGSVRVSEYNQRIIGLIQKGEGGVGRA